MAAPAILKIDIIADATKALRGLQDTEEGAKGISSSIGSLGKVVGGALAGVGLASFGKASVDAATESAVANARLEAVFASMGDATGQAAKAAEDYAGALSKRIGVDDEVIQAGQAQLATFGAVSDATARQAGIFDRATAAGADLAAAGFGSIESNAVQLGKALQDPEKGMTALAKSGVTFTDAQKDQIKALQDSGDLLGAQKIVLAAVEGQVKGTAAATVTSQQKATVAYGELQETIGGKLLPVVNTAMDLFTRYSGIILPLVGVIAGLVVVTQAWALMQTVASVATGVWTGVQAAFNVVMALNPIALVVIGIVALIAIIVLAYQKVGWFRDGIDALWQGIQTAFDAILGIVRGVFGWVSDNWPTLLAILTGPIGIAVLLITKNWDTLKDAARAMVGWVSDRFQDLVGFVSRVAETIGGIMQGIWAAIRLPMDAATAMVDWVTGKFQALVDFLRGIVDTVGGLAGRIAEGLKGPINGVIRAWNNLEFSIPRVEVAGITVFPGASFGTPNIPTLARGGQVLRTGMALVHEGETFSGVGRSLGGTVVNVTIQHTGLGVDSPQLQRDVVAAIRGYVGRNGPLGVPIVGS